MFCACRPTTKPRGEPFSEGDGNAPGNSPWYSDNAKVNRITGYKPVEFRNGYPVFDRYAQETVFLREMKGTDADFAPADRELARRNGQFKADKSPNQRWAEKYREKNGLTWHQHQAV